MFEVPFIHKHIDIDCNRIVNSIRSHIETLKIPNPWAGQSHVITSIASGAEEGWQDEELFKAIQPLMKEYIDLSIGLNVKLNCHMWYNVYNEGFSQEQHNHISSGTIASGIVYVQMPEKSTATKFINPNTLLYNSTEYKEEFKYYTPKVKPGDCIMFPPWLEHRVDKQFDITNTRVTVAFNISNR